MNKRFIAIILTVVGVVGLGPLSYRYISETRGYYQIHQPTRVDAAPTFLYAIGDEPVGPKTPLGVFVRQGIVYITSADNRLLTTDREGGKPQSFSLGTADKTRSPRSVVVDDEGRIYVSAGQGKGIVVLDPQGRPVKKQAFASDLLRNPVGLAISKDRLYVTDVGDHTVKIFTLRGKLVKRFGGPGGGEGLLQYPNGVTVAPDGTIYVADSNNSRVQVFDQNGRFVKILPQPSAAADRILLPRSTAIDKLGRVHVVDTLQGLIHVYSAKHQYLFAYGRADKNGVKPAYPNSIFIDKETGLIFLADRLNNRIAVWGEK